MSGCFNCGLRHVGDVAPLDMLIAIGFGSAVVTRDGETVLDGEAAIETGVDVRVRDAELSARAEPDHDWRIRIDGPMWSATWRREGEDRWVIVETGDGFA